MNLMQFLMMSTVATGLAGRSLNGNWNIVSFSAGDGKLLSGMSNLHLKGVCYESKGKSPFSFDWADNGFNVTVFAQTEKAIHPMVHNDTLIIRSSTIGPGEKNAEGMHEGEEITLKVLSKSAVIVWRDDRNEIDFNLVVQRERASLDLIHYRNSKTRKKYVVLKSTTSAFGVCKTVLPPWQW